MADRHVAAALIVAIMLKKENRTEEIYLIKQKSIGFWE